MKQWTVCLQLIVVQAKEVLAIVLIKYKYKNPGSKRILERDN